VVVQGPHPRAPPHGPRTRSPAGGCAAADVSVAPRSGGPDPPPMRDQVAGEAGARVAGHPGQPPAVVNTGEAAGADGSRAHVAAARAHPRPRRSSGCASAEGTSSGGWWHTAHTSRSSRGATPRAHGVRVSRRLPTRAPAVAPRGVTRPRAAVIAVVQRRARRRARACLKGPCRRGTACGLCGDRGVAHTGVVRQTTCRGLWHALRVFIRGDDVATRSWEPGVSCGSWSSPKRILSLELNLIGSETRALFIPKG